MKSMNANINEGMLKKPRVSQHDLLSKQLDLIITRLQHSKLGNSSAVGEERTPTGNQQSVILISVINLIDEQQFCASDEK